MASSDLLIIQANFAWRVVGFVEELQRLYMFLGKINKTIGRMVFALKRILVHLALVRGPKSEASCTPPFMKGRKGALHSLKPENPSL